MKEHIQDILVGGRPMTKLELANKEINDLRNIIKEVREILNNKREILTSQLLNGGYCNYEELLYQVDEEIREILDKENK